MFSPFSADWVGVEDPWTGVDVDLVALQTIVCQVFHISMTECQPPTELGLREQPNYARVYSFQLPSQTIVARLVAPVKPLFKTESEVAAMDFVRSNTSLPVPQVFTYCSEATNPVGAEWVIMEHVPGVEMGEAWDDLQLPQKQRLALDIIDLYDQLSRLKADGCGGIYHSISSVDDRTILDKSTMDSFEMKHRRAPRWAPLSPESLRLLRSLCDHPIHDGYELGPIHDISLLDYQQRVPSPSQTMPTFTTEEYFKLVAFNGIPSTRSDYDYPTREKCVELFQNIHKLYPHSTVFGPSADAHKFRFSHGDLHDGNILIDPQSGAITGIIDWEAAAFRPLWAEVCGVSWFQEDRHRFIFGKDDPLNFGDDVDPEDPQLRAFFRTELYRRNPDLFWCFLGGIDLRAVLHAAVDVPRPWGGSHIFLQKYLWLGYWQEHRRGAFPWDMQAWRHRRVDLDEIDQARRAAAMKEAQASSS